MFMVITLLALSGAAIAQRNTPHPCSTATGPIFVNDYATCESYFWCSGANVGYPSGPCPTGQIFDEVQQACNSDPLTSCLLCPGTGSHAVRLHFKSIKVNEKDWINSQVGHPDDVDCTKYHFCNDAIRDLPEIVYTCAAGTRFNRFVWF